jgi:hypothetical protein
MMQSLENLDFEALDVDLEEARQPEFSISASRVVTSTRIFWSFSNGQSARRLAVESVP